MTDNDKAYIYNTFSKYFDNMVGITIRQKDPADLESLEKLLKLV